MHAADQKMALQARHGDHSIFFHFAVWRNAFSYLLSLSLGGAVSVDQELKESANSSVGLRNI